MKEVNDLLRKNNLRPYKYVKDGKSIIVETDCKKVVIKPKTNIEILKYLNSRSFDYYPNILNDLEDDYYIYDYIEEIDIPVEQKIMDMVDLVSLLHNKTTFYKEVDSSFYKKIYEDINNNIEYLYGYYNDLMTSIESKVYMSPSEYLLARNITIVYYNLYKSKNDLEDWYSLVKEKKRTRQVVLHNNLDLSHFLKNKNSYLISWDKSKIDIPIYDLYKLYKKNINYSFKVILQRYEKEYKLLEEEKKLLIILISLPDKLEFDEREYNMTRKVFNLIESYNKIEELKEEEKSKQEAQK